MRRRSWAQARAGLSRLARAETLVDVAVEGEGGLQAVVGLGVERLEPLVVQLGQGVGDAHQPLEVRALQPRRGLGQGGDVVLQLRRAEGDGARAG
jgi:hypothetical protein